MNLAALTDLASQLGAFGVAMIVIFALMSGRLVTRGRVEELKDERDNAAREARDEKLRLEAHLEACRERLGYEHEHPP